MHKLYCHRPPRVSSSHEPQIDARCRSGVKDFQVWQGTPPQQLQHHACSSLLLVWPGAHHTTSLHRLGLWAGNLLCSEQSGLPLTLQALLLHHVRNTHVTRRTKNMTLSEAISPQQGHAALPLPAHQSWTPRKYTVQVGAFCPASWAGPLLLVENLSNNPCLHFQFVDYCISTPEPQTQLVITQWSVP